MTDEGGARRRSRWPGWVYGRGTEPDPRFSLANERTFLAWIRTSLGLIAAGVAARALLSGRPAQVAAALLVALGILATGCAAIRWAVSERALRQGRPLPPLSAGLVVALGLAVAAVVLLVLVVT